MVLSKGMVLDEHEAEGAITVLVAEASIRFDAGGDQRAIPRRIVDLGRRHSSHGLSFGR